MFLGVHKVESAAHVQIIDRLLSSAGRRTQLIAQIEGAQGLARAEEIATSSARLAGLMFGTADMAADLGADLSWSSLLYARSRLIAAAALRALLTIDAPFFALKNTDVPRL